MHSRCSRVLLAAGGLVMLVGVFTAADAGQLEQNAVVIDKVVDGSAPPGTVFEIEVSCTGLAVAGPPLVTTLEFDAAGDALGADTAPARAQDQCTVTETVTGGAAVSYGCEVVTVAGCFRDDVVEFGDVTDGVGIVTVTNTFEPSPEPEPDAEPVTDARPPSVVEGRPSFTG